jgi:Mlc titration factor MtfA (ptsG expression regulator)
MLNWWRRRREAHVLQHRAIPDELWLATLAAYPFLKHRALADLLRLRELATLFMARKQFHAAGGLVLDDAMALAIAAQACLPVLELGLDCYNGFVGIVIQPDQVVAQRSWTDEHGISHEGSEVLAGEVMPGGPVMLSWPDVAEAGESAASGYNVVIHEFVHVLDMANGEANGLPPLPDRAARERWLQVMQAAHQALCEQIEAGVQTWLDPYAANGLEEFFPVSAEAFFVAPLDLRAHHPEVYRVLGDFFRQDPARHARPGWR